MTGDETVRALTKRQLSAVATRQRMMSAAYRVFSSNGYGKATMAMIAADAGVAVQTLYFTFHTKADLLQAAYEFAVLGPEPVPPHLTDWWRAVEASPTAESAVDAMVVGTVEIFERAAPLVWAVHSDPDARAAYRYNEGLRSDGVSRLIAILEGKAPLRPGLDAAHAHDILLHLLSPSTYMLFVTESGWSTDEYGAWAAGAIVRELFSPGN